MNFKYYHTERLTILILSLTLVITPLSNFIEEKIAANKAINVLYGYIGVFSTISILTLVLLLINNYLWQFKAFKWLVNIPNLNGRYQGELVSMFIDTATNQQTRKHCVIEVKQNASKIKLHSYYGDLNTLEQTSQAESVSEEIIEQSNGIFEVFYIFSNSASALETQLNNHIGTCSLSYFPDTKRLEGEYYNQRGLKGIIKVSFIQTKLLGRLKA
ncbi:MAG: hypothetical protein R2796_07085 [Chitinophagaceae bacterium]